MYETYLQNERKIKEKYQYKFQAFLNTEQLPEDFKTQSPVLSTIKIGYLSFVPSIYNDNRQLLIKVMKALEKELAEGKKDFPLQHDLKGNCDFSYNQGLDVSLDKIRDFISKLEQ